MSGTAETDRAVYTARFAFLEENTSACVAMKNGKDVGGLRFLVFSFKTYDITVG